MNPIGNKKNLDKIIEELRESANSYLLKYSSTKQQLRTYLFKKILKKNKILTAKKEILNLIDIIIVDLEKNNFISDKHYSDSRSRSYLKRGYSLNKIRQRLINKGIDKKYVQLSLSKIKDTETDPDFFSAIKMCKKRRIGPIREESNRSLFYKKDMGVLARSGFNYELSKKILDMPKVEFFNIIKFI